MHFAACIGVVARRNGFVMIEAAGRDVDLIGMVIGLKRQLGAAMGTEAAASLAARSEVRRITLYESKLGRSYAEPGDKRRARSAPADGAMAIRFVERAARHLVTNPPAKASALQHRGLLYKDEWPILLAPEARIRTSSTDSLVRVKHACLRGALHANDLSPCGVFCSCGSVPGPGCKAGASARQRRPFVEERHDPRSCDVAGFQPVEPKARFGKQIVDLAVEVTPAREPQPERIEAILPAGDTRFRRASMLHE